MIFKTALLILLITISYPYLQNRIRILRLFSQNNPAILPETSAWGDDRGMMSPTVRFEDRVRSCEDAIIVPSEGKKGIALTACDAGRERWNDVMGVFHPGEREDEEGGEKLIRGAELFVMRYDASSGEGDESDEDTLTKIPITNYPAKDGSADYDIKTLGLAYDSHTGLLYLCNHRRGGPRIDIFRLEGLQDEAKSDELKAVWMRSLEHPLIRIPNSIALPPHDAPAPDYAIEGKKCSHIYVTNDHHFLIAESRLLAQIETYLALPLGTVVRVDYCEDDEGGKQGEVQAQVLARLPFANGIEFLPSTQNSTKREVAVSSTSRGAVHIYDIEEGGETEKWTFASEIPVPFFPDNLAVTEGSASSLLISGHPHVPSMGKFAATRWICNEEGAELAAADAAMKEYCLGPGPKTGSWVMEWDLDGSGSSEERKEPKTLYSGTGYPTSATASWDRERGVGIVAGLYAKGLMVWRR